MTNVENSYSDLKFFSALLFCSSKQADPLSFSEEREEILSISIESKEHYFFKFTWSQKTLGEES